MPAFLRLLLPIYGEIREAAHTTAVGQGTMMTEDCSLLMTNNTAAPADDDRWQIELMRQEWVVRLGQLLATDQHRYERNLARARYSPQLAYGRHFAPPGISARPAAVMVLLELEGPLLHWSESCLPLTVRPLYLADHPGQVSFPGGRLEKGETAHDAATREFCEELGVSSFPGVVMGSLSPMWVFHSNFYLMPFVAIRCGKSVYSPCTREVARLIQLPIAELLNVNRPNRQRFSRGNISWDAQVFHFQQDCIWGATAMILAELVTLLKLIDID